MTDRHASGTSREGSQSVPENQGDRSPDASGRPGEEIPVNRKLDSRGIGQTERHTGPVEPDVVAEPEVEVEQPRRARK